MERWAIELFDSMEWELMLHRTGREELHKARRWHLTENAERNQAEEALLAYGGLFGGDFLKGISDRFMDIAGNE